MKLPFILSSILPFLAHSSPSPLTNYYSSSSSSSSSQDEGFLIDPLLPSGRYSITLHPTNPSEHLIRRHDPSSDKWHTLQKRGGTGQYSFLVDDETGLVKEVSLDLHGATSLPLPVTSTHCHHRYKYKAFAYDLIQDDYYASKQAFYNWCDMFTIMKGHVELALNGNVAVYVCQRQVPLIKETFCSEGEYEAAEKHMNETCGRRPAWVYMGKWNKEYGRSWKGERVCRKWGKVHGNQKSTKSPGFGDYEVYKEP